MAMRLGDRFGRRAVTRGLLSAGMASAAASSIEVGARRRQGGDGSTVDPVVAAAVAMTIGGAMELPWMALPLGVLSAGMATVRIRRSRVNPLGMVGAATVGIGAAIASRRVWPVAPKSAELRPVRTPRQSQPSDSGEGLVVLINPGAGSAVDGDLADAIRVGLPQAQVVELDEGTDLEAALGDVAKGARALGMAGGDGSLNAAAGVAHERGLPLMVIPAGTLNHLARDLGLDSVEQAIDAVRRGDLAFMDVGDIDGKPFLNTASFGSYAELVDTREQLEERTGKWPAMVVALARVLRRARPLVIEIDGTRRSLWMIFIGNCRYHPHGFAPTWRERLDDGLLDVRLVSAQSPGSRARLVVAVLTGRLSRCRVYEEQTVTELHVRSFDGPVRLARDGETFDGSVEFTVTKRAKPLMVYVPHDADQSSSTRR
jgi:undecaprenyl-diphosphatase